MYIFYFIFFNPGRRVVFNLAKRKPFNRAADGLNLNQTVWASGPNLKKKPCFQYQTRGCFWLS